MSLGKWESESLNKRPIKAKGQLLVEGRTPEIFFLKLIQHLGLEDQVEVRTFGDVGKNTLQTYLEIFTQKSDFKERVTALGIIRDAESGSAVGAFQSVCASVTGAGLSVPNTLSSFDGSPLRTGIYILPDNNASGMLESLIWQAAQETDATNGNVLPCVERFFDCITANNSTYARAPKAEVAAYLLGKGIIDPQVGRGAQQNAIPWNAAAFQPLIAFLRQLAANP